MSLYSKLKEEGFSGLSAANIEMVLQMMHSELARMTSEQRKQFWATDLQSRLKNYAEVMGLNKDIF